MKIKEVFKTVGHFLSDHADRITEVGGAVAVVAGTVLIAKATKNVDPILEDANHRIEDIKSQDREEGKESDKAVKKELTAAYTKTGVNLAKNFLWGAVTVGTGLALMTTSNHILRNRNEKLAKEVADLKKTVTGLSASVTALSYTLENYRKRVAEVVGEEKEQEIYDGIVTEMESVKEIDEDGKKHTVKKEVKKHTIKDPDKINDWAVFFDGSSRNYYKDANRNREFLENVQRYWNEVLHHQYDDKHISADGKHMVVSLNEILDDLGCARKKNGSRWGWVFDLDHDDPSKVKIDFGIYTVNDEAKLRFLDGTEPVILLDFNIMMDPETGEPIDITDYLPE